MGAKLDFVAIWLAKPRNRGGYQLSGILKIVLPFANGARVVGVSLLAQLLQIQSRQLENHQQSFVLRHWLGDSVPHLIEMRSPFYAAIVIHVDKGGQVLDDALARLELH